MLASMSGGFGLDASRADGVDERPVVLLVLVRVRLGERHERPVEDVAPAQIGGDGDPVARPRVRAGQRGTAQLAEGAHTGRHHELGFGDPLPVPQLPYVEVPSAAVDAVGPLPAQEDVTGGLHEPLARDHPLALGPVLARHAA